MTSMLWMMMLWCNRCLSSVCVVTTLSGSGEDAKVIYANFRLTAVVCGCCGEMEFLLDWTVPTFECAEGLLCIKWDYVRYHRRLVVDSQIWNKVTKIWATTEAPQWSWNVKCDQFEWNGFTSISSFECDNMQPLLCSNVLELNQCIAVNWSRANKNKILLQRSSRKRQQNLFFWMDFDSIHREEREWDFCIRRKKNFLFHFAWSHVFGRIELLRWLAAVWQFLPLFFPASSLRAVSDDVSRQLQLQVELMIVDLMAFLGGEIDV